MENKKIIVLGSAGYLGNIISRKLLNLGYSVVGIDTCLHGEEPIKDLLTHPKFTLVKEDFKDIDTTIHLKNAHAIIHLAALVGDPACNLDEDQTIQVNYLATVAFAEAAKLYGVERFLMASSTSCYGSGNTLLYEGSPTKPLSVYAKTKLMCEQALMRYPEINPVMLRTATVYGLSPRMRFDLVVNIMVAKAVQTGLIDVYGGDQWRPFVHVEDIADAYIHLMEAPLWKVSGQIFNIVGENYTIKQLGNIIAGIVPGTKINVKDDPTFKITKDGLQAEDKRDYYVSADKVGSMVHFHPKHTIAGEVPKMVQWIQDNKVDITEIKYSNEKTLRRTYEDLLKKGEVDKV